MTKRNIVNLLSTASLPGKKTTALALPPLAPRLVKREAKSLSLALLKAKDNANADGNG